MSESNSNVIPAINAVDGFNPADFVRTTVGEEGENDLYLDVKYRLLWFRLHHPNGKIDPELIRVDEKNAIVCCRIYADKADPADQFIGKAYSQRFSTEDRFGDRFLEIAVLSAVFLKAVDQENGIVQRNSQLQNISGGVRHKRDLPEDQVTARVQNDRHAKAH